MHRSRCPVPFCPAKNSIAAAPPAPPLPVSPVGPVRPDTSATTPIITPATNYRDANEGDESGPTRS
jgi:hypothetical protein